MRQLLYEQDVEAARALLGDLNARFPFSEEITRYAGAIAPNRAIIRRGEARRSLREDQEWLRDHAHEHPGCWIALYGGELLAAAPSLEQILIEARAKVDARDVLVHFEPAAETPA